MEVTQTALPGVVLIQPKVHGDVRGFFMELFHADRYAQAGVPSTFLQDNLSRSSKGILRGLHFQEPNGQGKLVQVVSGTVFDVAVDVRKGSPHFGKWVGYELSSDNRRQMFVPAGFAHGFCVLSDTADFLYKCTTLYAPQHEQSILWNDPDIGIEWPVKEPLLSKKDAVAPRLKDAASLPTF